MATGIVILLLIINIVIAILKGRSAFWWAIWSLIFPIFSLILLILLPSVDS